MTIEQKIEEALKKATPSHWCMIDDQLLGADRTTIGTIYDEENQNLIVWVPEWLRHQQSIIKNQAEEIAALKQQLEDYEHGHNAEMEGMDESSC